MKLGMMGLPQTGKKLLFGLLTGSDPSAAIDAQKAVAGIAEIRDARFDKLAAMYEPKKEAPARIDIQLLPKLEPGSSKENEIFREIADVDALCHIVRAFADESVYHVKGSVDPDRDIDAINSELILQDLLFIEKRLERIAKDRKKKDEKRLKEEEELMIQFRDHLEEDKPLRVLEIEDEVMGIISGYPFLTMKKLLVVLNIDDSDISESKTLSNLSDKYSSHSIDFIQVPVKMESEIELLDSDEEKREFMEAVGIEESALNLLSSLAMRSLGLISYFTVGKDEVRQWLVRENSTAPVAAGVIHSDIERGFIRAEVIKYDDLMELGGEEEVKKAGKLLVMGKDYIVVDGDIVNFRFNV
ncbi:MAG: redox-regulated ATPase YchF [bacterium]|nr:redox-regulated ATPase YchF [bacterium]